MLFSVKPRIAEKSSPRPGNKKEPSARSISMNALAKNHIHKDCTRAPQLFNFFLALRLDIIAL
jgi:hypothetical protein